MVAISDIRYLKHGGDTTCILVGSNKDYMAIVDGKNIYKLVN